MIDSPLLKRLGSHVAGRWSEDGTSPEIPVVDPATGETLARVPGAGGPETWAAVDAGAASLADSAPPGTRASWLAAIAELHRANRDELARIITLENGKPIAEARTEVEYAAGFYAYAAEHVDLLSDRVLKERPRAHRWTVRYRPAGVAGIITPWNFPLAMAAKKLSAALAADCAMVVKPSEKTPLAMIALFSLLQDLDLPAGKMNLVVGEPEAIGEALLSHPEVRIVSFTGSTAVGRKLIRASAAGVKRVALELGGNAPFLVFGDADLDAAGEHLVRNKFRNSGQTCVCSNRVLVQETIGREFAERAAERVRRLKVGHGLQGSEVGPLIDEAGRDKVARHVRDAIDRGAEVLCGGRPVEGRGYFHEPTVLWGVTGDMLCAREETFGPVVAMMTFRDEDEALRMANDTEHGLAAYCFTGDTARADRLVAGLRFGHVGRNTGTGPTPEAPFGGMKHSGFGREGGREGLFEFTEPQTEATPVAE